MANPDGVPRVALKLDWSTSLGVTLDREWSTGNGSCTPYTTRRTRLETEVAAMDQVRATGFRGLGVLGFWSAPVRTEPVQASSIREDETALCLDCHVYFNIRNRACPKCEGEHFWLIANWKKPATRAAVPVAKIACA
jgi:hypothetical protein